jgi:hypothetical protein
MLLLRARVTDGKERPCTLWIGDQKRWWRLLVDDGQLPTSVLYTVALEDDALRSWSIWETLKIGWKIRDNPIKSFLCYRFFLLFLNFSLFCWQRLLHLLREHFPFRHHEAATKNFYRRRSYEGVRWKKGWRWKWKVVYVWGISRLLPWLGNRIFIVNDSILNNAPSTWSAPK